MHIVVIKLIIHKVPIHIVAYFMYQFRHTKPQCYRKSKFICIAVNVEFKETRLNYFQTNMFCLHNSIK